jgi:hypothetical protein
VPKWASDKEALRYRFDSILVTMIEISLLRERKKKNEKNKFYAVTPTWAAGKVNSTGSSEGTAFAVFELLSSPELDLWALHSDMKSVNI